MTLFVLRNVVCIAMLLNFSSALSNVGFLRHDINDNQKPNHRSLASWMSPEYQQLFEEDNRALWRMMDSSLSLSMSMGHNMPGDIPTNVPSIAGSPSPTVSTSPTLSPSSSPSISEAPSAVPTKRPTFAPGTGGFVPLNQDPTTNSAASGAAGMGTVGIALLSVGCVAAVLAAAVALVLYKKKQGGGNSGGSSTSGEGNSPGANV